jgi:hypothetical protein
VVAGYLYFEQREKENKLRSIMTVALKDANQYGTHL